MPSRRALRLAALVVVLGVAASSARARKVTTEEAEALRAAAATAWNVRGAAPHPLVLTGAVEVPREGAEPLRGAWRLEVVGPGAWREEIDVGGYRETFAGSAEGWWLVRQPERYLQLVAEVLDALDPAGRLALSADDAIVSAKQRGDAGPVELRIESRGPVPPAWRPTIAPSGRLARLEGLLNFTTYQYDGAVTAAGAEFPATVSVLHDGRPAAVVRVEASAPEAVDPARLAPPPGVRPLRLSGAQPCETVRLDRTQQGDFASPSETRLLGGTGEIRTLLSVAEDGSLADVVVRWANDPAYVEPLLDAVRGMRFKPPRCDGQPSALLLQMTFGHGSR